MNIRSILKTVVVIVLLDMVCTSYATEGTWTRKADMPTRRLGLSTSVVNGKIYAIGGGYSIEGPHSRIVEEYDPETDTWIRKTDMPTGRIGHAASVVNGKIYVVGGDVRPEVSCSTVEEYDPSTDTWVLRADMPTKRTFLCACAAEGKIYAIGGITAPAMHTLSTVEVYDPATDTWTTKANMPTPRWVLSTCTVNDKIYAVGGRSSGILRTVEEYDPTTDTWARKADMPTTRACLCTSVVNGKIYAIGGSSGTTGPVLKTAEEYDPITNTWAVKTDMPSPRWFFSTSAVNGKIYAIGGATGYPPHSSVSTVERFDLAPVPPDFNGDGKVDGIDVLIMADHWGLDDPTCDIAPLPFGDGIVDVQDLIALADYIGKELDDPTLVAHWALDEAEGTVAHDSAGHNDGTVVDLPLWLPDGGKVGGALEFDGMTSIVTDFVLDPSDGPFTAFAWIQGGMPGQTILSQINGRNWLSIDQVIGALTTELTVGLIIKPLVSQAVITDGDWHRVGASWDGANLVLYVDDVEVARKAQSSMPGSQNGLYIGIGSKLGVDTFFSGLIDDVRIYNRVISP